MGTPQHPSPAGFHAAQAVVDAVQALVGIRAIAALVTTLGVTRTWGGRERLSIPEPPLPGCSEDIRPGQTDMEKGPSAYLILYLLPY